MRTGRPTKPLELTEDEQRQLEQWARRPKSAQRLALRANIVLHCAEGKENQDVAEHPHVCPKTVCKWRERSRASRLDGLCDEPRPGAPRTVLDDKVYEVVTRSLESTPRGATHWSTRAMAQEAHISRQTVSVIWRAFGLKPHRQATFKEYLEFLKAIEANVPQDLEVHVVADNSATHKTPRVARWLARHPHWHIHYTPTGASWLNQVERFFAEITIKRIRRGTFRSVASLERAILEYLDCHNQAPKPFAWTATADQILAKIARLCASTSLTANARPLRAGTRARCAAARAGWWRPRWPGWLP